MGVIWISPFAVCLESSQKILKENIMDGGDVLFIAGTVISEK